MTIPHHGVAGAHGETSRYSVPCNCIPKSEWCLGQIPFAFTLGKVQSDSKEVYSKDVGTAAVTAHESIAIIKEGKSKYEIVCVLHRMEIVVTLV